jgi:UDP-N-acetylmuramyl pentapeptide phosphotransferase/UDP-N-acetylglucosamine-1-phosphate transferase
MLTLLWAFLTAGLLTYITIPSIIRIALAKHLCDEPGARRSHTVRTPSLGGIGIFAGLIFSLVLWTPFVQFGNLQYILCAFIILFFVGGKDDIQAMNPNTKLLAQILAAAILVILADIRLLGLYGFFGWHTAMPEWLSTVFSIFTILVIINGFNLIDGINGLAAGLVTLVSSILGLWFLQIEHLEFATLAFATVGSCVAFLRYNVTPARIFMGDTGSLTLGMVTAVLVIEFIDLNAALPPSHLMHLEGIPAVAVGVIILPLFDTLRVFTTRIYRGQSPFKPDRRHIHHMLIDCGYTHMQATGILLLVSAGFIALVFSLHNILEQHLLLISVFLLAGALTLLLHRKVQRERKRQDNKKHLPQHLTT